MYDIYYAHHQWKYGSQVEEYELDLIRRYFPNAKIFNPAVDLVSTKEDGEAVVMEECLSTVENSDIFVFSSVNETVGIGVYQEVMHAKNCGKIIFYICKDALTMDYQLTQRTDTGKTDRMFAFVNHDFY